jgi:hypothetical protein
VTDDTVSNEQMLSIGLNYRRLDYWARRGYLRPEKDGDGSGFARRWPRSEYDVARAMWRLVSAGMNVPAAARVARLAVEAGEHTVTIPTPEGPVEISWGDGAAEEPEGNGDAA